MRGSALSSLAAGLAELQGEHEALQAAHGGLVAKDLAAVGLLRDKWVASLAARLQEAEWKLATARRRSATWGMPLMVPNGRCERGIQTQAAEVWAAGQEGGLLDGAPPQVGALLTASIAPERPLLPGEAAPGAVAAAASRRVVPAFTQHGRVVDAPPPSSGEPPRSSTRPASPASWLARAQALTEAGRSDGSGGLLPLLGRSAMLRLVSDLTAAKAKADAAAAHTGGHPQSWADAAWRHCCAAGGGEGDTSGLQSAAQLLAALTAHAATSPDVARLAAALQQELQQAADAARAATPTPPPPQPERSLGGWGSLRMASSKRLPSPLTGGMLMAAGSEQALALLAAWPGMRHWLAWAESGAFLKPLQLAGCLGNRLTDVQVPQVCVFARPPLACVLLPAG